MTIERAEKQSLFWQYTLTIEVYQNWHECMHVSNKINKFEYQSQGFILSKKQAEQTPIVVILFTLHIINVYVS